MARFPLKESEVLELSQLMVSGFNANLAIYPAPPVLPLNLGGLITAYVVAKNNLSAAQAAAEAATESKDDALESLADAMKSDIRYAENTVDYDDVKLKLIGWAGRKASSAITLPGQARLLEAPKQGEGWVFLDWKTPVEGGTPAAYRVTRRLRPEGPWEDVATALKTEATLVEQPIKTELEYRIIAVNKAGDGHPSDTVMVVM